MLILLMSKPRNIEAPNTTIQVTWGQKDRMSVYRMPKQVEPGKKPRNEKDPVVFERILKYYEQHHPVKDPIPKQTIPNVEVVKPTSKKS